jgi:small subunit ribosomal protein S17
MNATSQAKQVKSIVGEIVSHSTPKTAIVKVSAFKMHRKYHKRYTVTKRYVVHDDRNEYRVGDKVEIIPCRPTSRLKRFVISRKFNRTS